MYTNILGYNVYNRSKDEFIDLIKTKEEKVNIISGNPEILYNGLINPMLSKVFKSEDAVIIPDGIGTVIASKIMKNPVKERIAGIEVMKEIIEYCIMNNQKIYLLGATQETIEKCTENLKKQYSNLKIAGFHNGYFDIDNCEEIIKDIIEQNPYAIFIAMGSPRQELFIQKYKEQINSRIFMGVGGSFDIFAGTLKRAPKWMIKLGLEWLYRVSKEPWRIRRLSAIPKFLLLVIKDQKNRRKK
ncbi:WecB/TagA/CpsF family glycosyltransferase [Inconstantimicrobium mannanitabidum]|uniref:UDP-N-acetyl-D-mannosaminuronic acid transferase n=1 Tax=Inconstantimicrobium mannanitabidum TaxID=1604901 RepID=A0ACB5RAV3_9CLOT|nr:WecB/TagA/CpsF family glycosyltransferase [Clostridium sp. TW13]GKX66106.1 UDP-N-acetyl-D-mannosaminuronic acid transferase [Clostridium sp. TW13]